MGSRLGHALALPLACLVLAGAASATLGGQALDTTVRAGADATVSESAPGGRFGREKTLLVSGEPDLRAYLRFTVPAGTKITRATLRLYAATGHRATVTVRAAAAAWTESGVSYRKAPRTGKASVRLAIRRGGWATVDVTRFARAGAVSLGLTTGSSRPVVFLSRENGARGPQLIVRRADPLPTVTIAAAGNIACNPASPAFNGGAGTDTECGMRRTGDLLAGMTDLDAILALGDNQYPCAAHSDFLAAFDPAWGRVKSLIRPIQGNHDWECDFSGRARGYFQYFGAAAGEEGKGYYSYDLGTWHLIALNSQCGHVGGCNADSPQGRWLQADLAANRSKCTLAYFHYPRFASGLEGDRSEGAPFWDQLYAAGADVILNAHEHHYERFARMTPAGVLDTQRGIRQFIVGTGGRELHGFQFNGRNSEVRRNASWGVLRLSLAPTSYSWQFVPTTAGAPADSGTTPCH